MLVSVTTNAVSAVNYTDLRPTYAPSSDYTDYVNTVLGQSGQITYYQNDKLQFRSNCYGYAMRIHYGPDDLDSYYYSPTEVKLYKQQPGEFYNKTSLNKTFSAFYNELDATDVENVYQYVLLDCRTLGYTASFVGMYDANESFIPPSASANTSKRLIALVVSRIKNDFHFYMQHEDNTWSHKLAEFEAMKSCKSCNTNTDGIILTNSNISSHIHCYDYDGDVILFYINAPGSSDRYNQDGHRPNPYYTPVSSKDIPGDYLCSALPYEGIYSGTISEKTDYIDDADYYIFDFSTTGNYSFSFTKSTYAYRVYIGEVLSGFGTSGTTTYTVAAANSYTSFTQYFQAGKRYYIKVVAYGQTDYSSSLAYTINYSRH